MAIFVLSSCTKENDSDPENKTEPTEESNYVVSYDEALKTLQAALSEIDGVETRGMAGQRKIASHYTVGQPVGETITRSVNGETPDPYVHIFNFEGEQGYAIVSGDKRTEDIFAITDTGFLEEGREVDNPGLILFLANAEAYYFSAIENYKEEPATRVASWSEYGSWSTYLYPTKGLSFNDWGQDDPYNRLIPLINGKYPPTGCTATATALIMAFYKYSGSYNGYTYNWDEMAKHLGPTTYYGPAISQITRLFQQLGLSSNLKMTYGLSGSTASESNIPRTLRNYGYSNGGSSGNYNETAVFNDLKNGYIVAVAGHSSKTKYKFLGITIKTIYDGHTWVIDRIIARSRTKTDYVNGIKKSTSTETQYILHCNWGWDGIDNGYYFSKAFNTDEAPVMTRGESAYNIQYNLKSVTGIRK